MSTPSIVMSAPKSQDPRPAEGAGVKSKPSSGPGSFADEMEKRLKESEKPEQKAPSDSGGAAAAVGASGDKKPAQGERDAPADESGDTSGALEASDGTAQTKEDAPKADAASKQDAKAPDQLASATALESNAPLPVPIEAQTTDAAPASGGETSPQPVDSRTTPTAVQTAVASKLDGPDGVSPGARPVSSPQALQGQGTEGKETSTAGKGDVDGTRDSKPLSTNLEALQKDTNPKPQVLEQLAAARERAPTAVQGHSEQASDVRPELISGVGRTAQAASASAPTASPNATPMPQAPANQSEWAGNVGNQIRWMLNNHRSIAELKLNPEELGSMEVRIALEKDTTNIHFVVQSAAAKSMLEDALPRLRNLLSDVGVNLQEVGVRERGAGGHQQNGSSGFAQGGGQALRNGAADAAVEAEEALVTSSGSLLSQRMIDAYA